MNIQENIRALREEKGITQEQMAEKLGLSVSGYSKIETSRSGIKTDRLEQIATILKVNIIDLYGENNKKANLQLEIEKLQLIIQHKDELLAQKDRELAAKDEIIALLRK